MIRSELVTRLADLNPQMRVREAEAVVDAILGRIEEALAAGDTVELRNVGTFSIRRREAREARNPRTGAKIEVPTKTDMHFKPGKAIRQRLNARPAPMAMAAEQAPPPDLLTGWRGVPCPHGGGAGTQRGSGGGC